MAMSLRNRGVAMNTKEFDLYKQRPPRYWDPPRLKLRYGGISRGELCFDCRGVVWNTDRGARYGMWYFTDDEIRAKGLCSLAHHRMYTRCACGSGESFHQYAIERLGPGNSKCWNKCRNWYVVRWCTRCTINYDHRYWFHILSQTQGTTKNLPWPRPLKEMIVEFLAGKQCDEELRETTRVSNWIMILTAPPGYEVDGRRYRSRPINSITGVTIGIDDDEQVNMLEKLSYVRDDSIYVQKPNGTFNCERNLLLRVIDFLGTSPIRRSSGSSRRPCDRVHV